MSLLFLVEDSQEKVKGPKVNELLVKLKRVVHKRPRNSDSDTEGEGKNLKKGLFEDKG
jgi:hypothetical protein